MPVAAPMMVECDHPLVELRRFIMSNGSEHIVRQCQVCGRRTDGAFVPKALVWDVANLPLFDRSIQERYAEAQVQSLSGLRPELRDSYYESDAWRAVRAARLLHDGFRCVCCGKQADQVHHLHYHTFREENMSDLISVCRACHEAIHAPWLCRRRGKR